MIKIVNLISVSNSMFRCSNILNIENVTYTIVMEYLILEDARFFFLHPPVSDI
jgi:hypothetical protein